MPNKYLRHQRNKLADNGLVVMMQGSILNLGTMGSKPLGGSKVHSAIHSSEINQMSIKNSIPGDLVVKSKLSPGSDSAALIQLNPIHKRGS